MPVGYIEVCHFSVFSSYLSFGEIRAVCLLRFALVQTSWTPWKSWTGLDIPSGSVDDVSFVNFLAC